VKYVCIHQPDFVPYLGFFHRLLFSDIFIIHDDVQFLRNGWHHRDKIKTKYGVKWLTLSVKKGKVNQEIRNVMLSENIHVWIKKKMNILKDSYGKASYFNDYFPQIEELFFSDVSKLIDLNMKFINFFLDIFDIKVKIIFSSDLNVNGYKTEKIINIMRAINRSHYLSGIGAKAYFDEKMFIKDGLQVKWQHFQHPIYPQLYGDFMPNLSCIDLLFNCGHKSKDILRSCEKMI